MHFPHQSLAHRCDPDILLMKLLTFQVIALRPISVPSHPSTASAVLLNVILEWLWHLLVNQFLPIDSLCQVIRKVQAFSHVGFTLKALEGTEKSERMRALQEQMQKGIGAAKKLCKGHLLVVGLEADSVIESAAEDLAVIDMPSEELDSLRVAWIEQIQLTSEHSFIHSYLKSQPPPRPYLGSNHWFSWMSCSSL